MKPILFKLFGLPIYGYGTMIALGIIAAVLLVSYRAKKQGYDEDSILNMSIIAIICGILGGKLLYIIVDIKIYIDDPKQLLDVGSGFVILGAIIAGGLAVYFYARKKKWDVLKVMDMAIPSIPLAQGFGRIGCFLAGCCYGAPVKNPSWGVVFKNSDFAPKDCAVYPTQIYSSIFDFCLAFFLLYYSRKERKKGRIFSLYVIIYSIGRFFIEFVRDDPRGTIGLLSTSQFISIFTLILGILVFNQSKILKHRQPILAEEVEQPKEIEAAREQEELDDVENSKSETELPDEKPFDDNSNDDEKPSDDNNSEDEDDN